MAETHETSSGTTVVHKEEITSNQPGGELQHIQAAYRLNGKNYLKWSQLVRTLLKGKGKLSHLLGTGPKEGEPNYDAWDEEDSMIIAWLWNSMLPEISDTCMFLPTARDIWESVKQTYSKVRDAAQIYDLKIKTTSTKQGSRSVTEYANHLKGLWQELDHYRCIEMKCAEDAVTLKKFIEKDRVYEFLAGLNTEFDQVRVQILGKEDLPSLNEAISVIVSEESRRGIMLESQPDSSAMFTNGAKSRGLKLEQQPSTEAAKAELPRTLSGDSRDNLWCTFCKKPRHTKEKCWKLHGKPSTSSKEWGYKGGQQSNQERVHLTTQQAEENSHAKKALSSEDIERLHNLLVTLKTPASTCSLAHSGQSSLEAEIDTLRKGVNNLQNKLRVGLEIETHLKKKVCDLEKLNILSEEKIKEQISTLLHFNSQCRRDITSLLDEGYSELKSIIDLVVEKIRKLELSGEHISNYPLTQDTELSESECRDVHLTAESDPDSNAKSSDPGIPTSSTPATADTSEVLAQALQEKVSALLLLSQQEERYLLEGNVNAALQKKVEELQRNLLQVTNEKVKALMELAQLKQERYTQQETGSQNVTQGKYLGEIQERRNLQEKDGKFKSFLKKTYLPSWVGGSYGNDAESQLNYEKPNSHMDFARMKIENATLKESLESMEHLLSSVRRLRISLLKIKDSTAAENSKTGCYETLDKIIYETKLLKTALSSSLPVSWSAETDGSYNDPNEVGLDPGYEKVDFVSRCGFEMVELLIFATTVLKDQISHNNQGGGVVVP